ncbi:hypothetical protein OOK29_25935 [Streptomyces phaeochromogenes]|uniref:hypothetical protein n=1 Tax=Streptomyces phaeochromogenes TaxID=1923 RepID=UPI00225B97CC|nr:hypothetical protein [Streptomyces phaeochromogenes]MCX5601595.1 hypothetical protein [Streptomyces phaeochromogenes]
MTIPLPAARSWAAANPWPAALAVGLTLIAVTVAVWILVRTVRRATLPPSAVCVAAVAAALCTAYSADVSWGFAHDYLKMTQAAERATLFAAAEVALLACGLMARANKAATATATSAGTPGVAGALMWVITGVQVIPCYAQSGLVGGSVRAMIGPVLAGLLWHMAMGLEIRVVRPGALSTGLPALVSRELRERLLSRLGLATRDRSAEQITRDRAMARAVRLASRPKLRAWGERRLAAAVAKARVGVDGEQRHRLLQELAARRGARDLMNVDLHSPWTSTAVPEPYPATPLGVTGAQLRAMDPFAAVLVVHGAHPEKTPAELSSILGEYGVPVSAVNVSIALRFSGRQEYFTVPAPGQQTPEPSQDEYEDEPESALVIDLKTGSEVHPAVTEPPPDRVLAASSPRAQVHARIDFLTPLEDLVDDSLGEGDEEDAEAGDEEADPGVPDEGKDGDEDPVVAHAREYDAYHRRTRRRPASIRTLMAELRIGQPRATQIRELLDRADAS